MSLGNARYRTLRAVLNAGVVILHLRVDDVTALDRNVSEKNAARFRAL